MITDPRALRPAFVPRDLHHREGAIETLSTALEPISRGRPGDHVLVTGPSGSGKTTLAKYTLGRLSESAASARWGYVDCWSDSTQTGVLHRLARDTGVGMDLRREGTPADRYIERFRRCDEQVVAVIDEGDLLDDDRLLQTLYGTPGVTLVTITINEDYLLTDIDSRVASRLRGTSRLRLTPYSHAELVDIIASRADHGLREDTITDDAVAKIADIAAGDARHAIGLLRRVATRATGTGRDQIDRGLIDTVVDEGKPARRERNLESLGTHLRLLYDIVAEGGGVSASTLHARYEQRAADPRSERQCRRYLDRLEKYGLLTVSGRTSDRYYELP